MLCTCSNLDFHVARKFRHLSKYPSRVKISSRRDARSRSRRTCLLPQPVAQHTPHRLPTRSVRCTLPRGSSDVSSVRLPLPHSSRARTFISLAQWLLLLRPWLRHGTLPSQATPAPPSGAPPPRPPPPSRRAPPVRDSPLCRLPRTRPRESRPTRACTDHRCRSVAGGKSLAAVSWTNRDSDQIVLTSLRRTETAPASAGVRVNAMAADAAVSRIGLCGLAVMGQVRTPLTTRPNIQITRKRTSIIALTNLQCRKHIAVPPSPSVDSPTIHQSMPTSCVAI